MIEQSIQENLRKRYNPDDSLLRQHQLRMLEMLKYIDEVCKRHDIDYWLCSGTLLGAVRHGGFIPWDDDVDVEMLRKDYVKLIKALKREKNSKYVVQTYQNDICYVSPFAKLRDKHSVIEGEGDRDYKYRGCSVDLFPMEYNTRRGQQFTSNIQIKCLNILALTNIVPKWLKMMILPILKFIIIDLFYSCCRTYNNLFTSKTELCHTYGVGFFKRRNVEYIFPLKRILFENVLLPVPGNFNAYLEDIYGKNYMEIPSEEKRITHNLEISLYAE